MIITIVLGLIVMNGLLYIGLFRAAKKADEEFEILLKKINSKDKKESNKKFKFEKNV